MPLQLTDVPSMEGIQEAIDERTDYDNPASPIYDTGWILVPVLAGFTAYTGRVPKVRRIGRHVMFMGSYYGASSGAAFPVSSTAALGTLPAGFRPIEFVPATVMAGSNATSGTVRGWIDSGGGIRVGTTVTTPYVAVAASFLTEP